MSTFAFCNQEMRNLCHREIILFKSYFENQFLLRAVSFYIEGDIYLSFIL